MNFTKLLKNRTVWLSTGVLSLLIIIFLASREGAPAVVVAQVKRGLIRQEITDFGTTRFKNIETLLAPGSGWIEKVLVSVGEQVSEGRTILLILSAGPAPLLDPRTRASLTAQWQSARAQVEQAKAQLRRLSLAHLSAKEELQRSERVFKGGGISLQDIDNLRGKVDALREEVRAMQAGLDSALHQRDAAEAAVSQTTVKVSGAATIRAPRNGIVSWIYDEKPRFVTIGSPILDIAHVGDLRFEIDILAREAMNIRVGLPVWFSDLPVRAHVRAISPTALPKISPLGISEQRTRIWIDFDSELPAQVPAGLELEAHIELAQRENTLTVAKTAIWNEQNVSYVFREKNGLLEKTPVRCGLQSARESEILAGMSEGDWVVQLPSEDLQAGQKIIPQKNNRPSISP